MLRREFLRSIVSTGGALAYDLKHPRSQSESADQTQPPPKPSQVRRVYAMFKCHFDAGFIDTQAHVVAKYFTTYFPEAIRVAEASRQAGKQRYVWTTGSWLLYEYLEQASAADRARMERAIASGDIAWHALPFNWQTELIDSSLMTGSLALSRSLDQRFGRRTTGAKMTDVPGHTRGVIAPLAKNGVTFLDIGVNAASRPAELPPMFLWKDPSGAPLIVMYHSGYGAVTQVPGSDVAIAIIVRGDNSGPHTPEEIAKIYSDLNEKFPKAEIIATDLTAIAHAVEPYKDSLPVVTQELGDTWIYGVSSDPLKLARYREVCRLRQQWIRDGKMSLGGAVDLNLMRHLLLEPEHTWGTDTKTWLDFDHYKPRDLAQMLHTKNYEVVQYSWVEKRRDLFDGVSTLPVAMREEAEQSIRKLEPVRPALAGGSSHNAKDEIETNHFILSLNPDNGAIQRLCMKSTNREWATREKMLGLFSYQTLSQADYDTFFKNYIISSAPWARKDFGKPNMESFGARSESWYPKLISVRRKSEDGGHHVLSELQIEDAEALSSGRASYPGRMYCELFLPENEPAVHLSYFWFDKPSTRMAESLWLTMDPSVKSTDGWEMVKSGQPVSPFDVVPCGSRHMHAVDSISYRDSDGQLNIEPTDAPLIALGERSPINFSRDQPNLDGGVHFNLYNNAWGTNYIQWYGEAMRLRFVLRFA